MPFLLSFLLLLLFQSAPPSGGLDVQAHEGHVSVHAQRVPLSKVLDRLAQQTGMKVVYETSPPSQAVSASLDSVLPRDAVVRLLEGQGVSYVFRTDATGKGVETLLVSGEGGNRQASNGGGSSSPAESMDYAAEVVDDAPDYEEPPAPVETSAPAAVPDLALPGGGMPGGIVDPGPSFPGGPAFPSNPGFPHSAPTFPGPVSNPFPN